MLQNFTIQNRQITFLDSRFYATDDGGYVPSVTTILEAYPKGAAYYNFLKENGADSDTIRDEAGRRGSVVHKLTEQYDAGEEVNLLDPSGNINYKLLEWAMFERYVDFRNRFPLKIIQTEWTLISPTLGFAGTLDRLIEMDGKTILLDIKTSNAIYPSHWLQLAAYEQLIIEAIGYNPIDSVGILWLNAKTRTNGKGDAVQGIGWQMVTKDDTTKDWELFQATYRLWQAENGDQKPKQLTYSLTHKLS